MENVNWNDIKVFIGGKEVAGVVAIDYGVARLVQSLDTIEKANKRTKQKKVNLTLKQRRELKKINKPK